MRFLLLVAFLALISIVRGNLYGVWQTNNIANFGVINQQGQTSLKLEFPNFVNTRPDNSAMNNLTTIMTFVLAQNGTEYLVTVNVAKNKVIYFVPIPSNLGQIEGLRYDSDVNSLKVCIPTNNNTYIVGEMDPASASYDVYGYVEGVLIGVGLSTYNHTYYVVTASTSETTLSKFDTRSAQHIGDVELIIPQQVTSGPYNLLYIPALDEIVGNVVVTDSNGNSGQDYAIIDPETGAVKPLGIFSPADQVNVITHAAHQNILYATVNYNAVLQFISIDLSQQKVVSQTPEGTFVVSMGYFTNV
ncbi:hypothetical protein DICPUDRAFT_98531 [Dictyostelium purpureum]|uniref:Uncharacterized protein n=1 Tax=Dictyostelium purpureum TaxID=5786 RepID=F0ZR86_DICPU|nr:uncharacterized protein DICPUDRAFT_98531 [Dictyostelium purpureum]EGC33542.1 hypothetical protein DICPUDRAFT_98531 [Dictyostelium purpureum]|eukprot:XP_003289924.1 hypothetical protein DICPUDRAFT_98531 [Dictyostelium purpureum]